MKFSWIAKFALLVMIVWGGGETVLADVQYTFTPIVVQGVSGGTLASGINDAGQIVGSYSGGGFASNGFLYSDGSFTTIDVPGASQTFAAGINDSGEIVGWFVTGSSFAQGFLYSNGTFTTLDYPGAGVTTLHGINNLGQIVGTSDTSGGFLYSGGSFSVIDYAGSSTQAYGINGSGQIVGYANIGVPPFSQCFIDSGGTFSPIGPPCLAALGINDAGEVVGSSGAYGGFLYGDGAFVPVNFPAGTQQASGINDSGQIVGNYIPGAGGVEGFLGTPTVPEPSTLPVLTASLLALFVMASRRKRMPRL